MNLVSVHVIMSAALCGDCLMSHVMTRVVYTQFPDLSDIEKHMPGFLEVSGLLCLCVCAIASHNLQH